MGFLKPSEGEIVVDGTNSSDAFDSWRKKIAFVSQTIYLLDDTITKNICFEEDESNLNSAVYFYKSNLHAYYGTGLFTEHAKRNLYGYCIIWKAIIYCIERGINSCELDDYVKFNWMSSIDKKLMDISFLKSGFGGELIPRIIFSING